MKKLKLIASAGRMAVAALVAASLSAKADADEFNLRIGAGQPMQPLEAIYMAHHFFVPEVKKRVEAQTEHKISFIEAYGGTVAGPFDTFEATEKGLFDIGLWCACFEPTKGVQFVFQYFMPFVTDDPHEQLKLTRKMYYEEFPEWPKSTEKFNQKYLAIGSFASYGLGTKFKWSKMEELKGKKIAGAGPNLPWIEHAGATPVQTSLNEAYNSLQSGVYDGLIIWAPAWQGFKLYEPAPVYTVTGFGSVPTYQMTINMDTWNKLPAEIQKIILEVSREYEVKTADEAAMRHKKSLEFMSKHITVQVLSDEEKAKMAKALGDWPARKAREFDEKGLPGSKLFQSYLKAAEEMGIKLPYKYNIN